MPLTMHSMTIVLFASAAICVAAYDESSLLQFKEYAAQNQAQGGRGSWDGSWDPYADGLTTFWCNSNKDMPNKCDGTEADCVSKGKAWCSATPSCKGIAYNSRWAARNKGWKVCKSNWQTPKTDGWVTYLKKR